MRSLATKLVLIALGVSLIQAGLTTWFAQRSASASFERFVREELETEFVQTAEDYYSDFGSFSGIERVIQAQGAEPGPPKDAGPPPDRRGEQPGRRGDNRIAPFALVDLQGSVFVPAGAFRPGTVADEKALAAGTPVVVNGQTVGFVLVNPAALTLTNREQRFMSDLFLAVAVAALAGLGVAFILSALLSRRVVRSLGDLTQAARRLASGDLAQSVSVNSKDEIGVLAEAFNSMSVSLDQSQSLRRQMTADIAHDLRTPLTVLQGYLEAMSSGDLEPTQERIELLYSEAKHLGHLVEDLRVLSLADAGELPLNTRRISAGYLLDSVQALLSRDAKSRGIEIRVEPEIDPIEIDVDPDQMKRVLINLVSNAIHHTPAGGMIAVSAKRSEASSADTNRSGSNSSRVPDSIDPGSDPDSRSSSVQLRVTDTGEGIAPADQPNVFERFYRSDTARHRTGNGGSGLGLAICKALVEAQGGKILVEETGPAGTTMRIDLPAIN